MRPFDIAVFGATGYTGRRIVRSLAAAGLSVLCAGRDRARLDQITADLGPAAHAAPIEGLGDAEAVCARAAAVVNAAGSFVQTCEPVARAAIATGTHYLDVSGEQRAIRRLFDELHDPAVRAGVALIPSAAFYAALADMLAALAAPGPADSLEIAYRVTGWTPSGAAYDNILRGLGRPMLQYDRGLIEITRPRAGVTDFGPPYGGQATVTYPAPEILTIPRHLDVARVGTVMTTATFRMPVPARLTPLAARALGLGLRTPAAPLVQKALAAVTGASTTRIDADPTTFRISARFLTAGEETRAVIDGRGIFDISAPITALLAAETLRPGFRRSGALTPAQVLDPKSFLDALSPYGVTYRTPDVLRWNPWRRR